MPTCVFPGVFASLQWGSASLTEIIWTLIGLTGLALTWGNLQDAKSYVEAVKTANGSHENRYEMEIISFGHYRNELFRTAKFLVITATGIVAMLTPSATPQQPVTPTGLTITFSLFALAVFMLMASALDRRQRNTLLTLIEQRASEERTRAT